MDLATIATLHCHKNTTLSGKLPVDSEEDMKRTDMSQSECFETTDESPPPIPPRL